MRAEREGIWAKEEPARRIRENGRKKSRGEGQVEQSIMTHINLNIIMELITLCVKLKNNESKNVDQSEKHIVNDKIYARI